MSDAWRSEPLAVLVSGGPDSMILAAELAESSPRVAPIYVRCGMTWEACEEAATQRFLQALARPNVDPLTVLEMPLAGVYGDHWSFNGRDVPDADSPDEAVFLPGRNLVVVLPAALWCRRKGIETLALGLLRGNPFPDGTDEFFNVYEQLLGIGLGGALRLPRPYANLDKIEVLKRGRDLPLRHTWSCVRPIEEEHCGACNKCAERQRAFAAAQMSDPTRYRC